MATAAERLEAIQQKKDKQTADYKKSMDQLKAREQALKAKQRKAERAERTRRLINNGALAEKYLQSEGAAPADFQLLLNFLVNNPLFVDLLRDAKEKATTVQRQRPPSA